MASFLLLFLLDSSVLIFTTIATSTSPTTLLPAVQVADSHACVFQPQCACSDHDDTPGHQHIHGMGCLIQNKWPSFLDAQETVQVDQMDISGNFTSIPAEAFKGLRSVEQMDIYGVGYTGISIVEVDKNAFEPTLTSTLHVLVIKRAPIARIPEAIKTLTRLTTLNIERATIGVLPNNSFQDVSQSSYLAPGLEFLVLAFCSLFQVEPNAFFGQGPSLQSLDLSHNSLLEYPKLAIAPLINLKQLSLDQNNMKTLSEGAFMGLNTLKTLALGHNRFSQLPNSAFTGLELSLQWLSLEGNSLNQLPSSISTLSSLQTLLLNQNFLPNITINSFSRLIKLSTLQLEFNPITNVERASLWGMRQLEIFSLSHTSLTNLDLNFLEGSSVKTLRISSNPYLESIHLSNGPMTIPASLETLKINSNPKLRAIPKDLGPLLLSRPNLALDLSDNEGIYCSCEFFWMNQVLDANPFQLVLYGSRCQNKGGMKLEDFINDLTSDCPFTQSQSTQTTTQSQDSSSGRGVQNLILILCAFLLVASL